MELKPGYKQTEVGGIPEDWEVQKLGSIATFLDGMRRPVKSSDRARMKGSIPYYGASGVVDYVDNYIFDEELVLLGEDGENILSRNLPLAFRISGKTWVNNHAHVIRPNPGISIGFLTEFLDSLNYESLNSGTAQPKLNQQNCLQIPVALPSSTDEQRAIATALSDVDALLDGLDRLIAKKRDLKQASMQQLLTGETRLPEFEGEWEHRSLIEIAEFQKSNFEDGDWIEAEHITDRGIRLIQTGNIGIGSFVEKDVRKYIYEESFIKLRCKELRVGDILICRLAEPAGRSCIFPNIGEERVITSVDVTIFRIREEAANPRFIVQYCSTENWFKSVLDNVGGTTHKRISRAALGKLLIPFPSIKEQTAIASVLSDMDEEIAAIEQRRAKTKDIKQAMMQELLTGKTRLVTPRGSNV